MMHGCGQLYKGLCKTLDPLPKRDTKGAPGCRERPWAIMQEARLLFGRFDAGGLGQNVLHFTGKLASWGQLQAHLVSLGAAGRQIILSCLGVDGGRLDESLTLEVIDERVFGINLD